ncbi:DUF6717 family protein [Pedobacter quisquiliarum]
MFRFHKDASNEWFIVIPEWTSYKAELEMVQGAATMLDLVGENSKECYLKLSDQTLNGVEVLKLEQARIQNQGGGGDYILDNFQSETINHKSWLCEVTRLVFNGLPQEIYFKKQPPSMPK